MNSVFRFCAIIKSEKFYIGKFSLLLRFLCEKYHDEYDVNFSVEEKSQNLIIFFRCQVQIFSAYKKWLFLLFSHELAIH